MKQFIISLALVLIPCIVFSQFSTGGEPIGKLLGVTQDLHPVIMPSVDREKLLDEDRMKLSEENDPAFRYGTVFDVNYDLNNSGIWINLPDGSRIWRISIHSANAFSINLFFNDFFMPRGGLMYIYNPEMSTILGAFTELNNSETHKFATAPTLGETTIIEYYEPEFSRGKGRVNVSNVVHAYKDIFGILTTDELPCNINVNCPVGAPWVEQKRAVTRITFMQGSGSYLCSGSLVNNALQNRTLYYLTAEHCSPTDHMSMVFYFNYENPTCYGSVGPLNQTLSGATLKAANYATDFRLVQINGTLPGSFNAYFNGWDRSGTQPTSEVAIHHPGGAVKKITFDYQPASHSSGFGGRLPNGFWQCIWDLGMTEGGSSGCPLYDQNKRVVGQNLGGAPSQCENPQAVYKVFGKFSESWGYGGSSSNQLKDWLDPNNSNIMTLDGIDAVAGSSPVANFTSDTQYLPIGGGNVNFYDLSTNMPTSWAWSFPGATPATSNVKNPTGVHYTNTGAYTVSLTSTNSNGSNTFTIVNYIKVAGVPLSSFNLVSPPNNSSITVGYNNPAIVKFDWQKSSPSATVKYMMKIKKLASPTEYTFTSDNNGADTIISLSKHFLDSVAALMGYIGDSVRCTWRAGATNGLDTLLSNVYLITLKSTTIGIQQIGTEIPEKFILYHNYPNPFNPGTVISFDVAKSSFIKIKVYDISGREVETLVKQELMPGKYKIDFNAGNLASGVYFYALESDNVYLVKKMVLLK